MKRLLGLDALRGFTVAGMILVNVPGSWSHVYAPLLHAKWNGLTIADLVFPFFIFIMGVSIVLAFSKILEKGTSKQLMITKVIKRSITIFVLGLILNLISYRFQEFRIPGVLQRIAIVYLTVSLLYICCKVQLIYIIGGILLIGYWLLMVFVPIPGEPIASLEPVTNWSNYIDSLVIPFKMYGGTWDPEGLLSTLPSIASAIAGVFVAEIIRKNKLTIQGVRLMLLSGLAFATIGGVWAFSFPVNKNLWSSSYVMLTAGMATLILALFIYLIDMRQKQKWAQVGLHFGANAISAYVLHYLLIIPLSWISISGKSIQEWFMYALPNMGCPHKLASFIWAISFIVICYLPIRLMYQRKIFIKI